MSGALQAVFQNQRSFGPPPGSQSYSAGTTGGTFTWVAPAGVTSISIVAVGGKGCGATPGTGGGGLGYKNNYSVTPANSYAVQVGGFSNNGSSFFVAACVVSGLGGTVGCGGGFSGDGGGTGGAGSTGGGGAGGYSGNGGAGYTSSNTGNGSAGSGGGGGGGGVATSPSMASFVGGGGGGVCLFGQGTSGSGGIGTPGGPGGGGGGGSGGVSGTNGSFTSYSCGCCVFYIGTGGTGGGYGGGRGWGPNFNGSAAGGGLRIVWPGNTRTFPSTNVGAP